MKKFLAAVTAASISFTTMASMGVFAYDSNRLDVNGDGSVNTVDALSVLKDVVGLNNQYHSKADIDLDGQVTSGDALYVLKHVVGISFDLPEPSSSETESSSEFVESSSEASSSPDVPSTGKSKEAQAVLDYITGVQGKNIISGQQESTWVSGPDYEMDYIQQTTGKLPAIRGLDFMDNDFDGVVSRAKSWWSKGGIVTIAWHTGADYASGYNNCMNDGFNNNMVVEGTAEYNAMIAGIDKAAGYLKQLKDAGVPVLWRPYHELDGHWFWWSKGGAENMKKLWQIMYDRYTNYWGLDNLIWVYGFSHCSGDEGVNPAEWYAGDEYVDIVGGDSYTDGANKNLYDQVWNVVQNRKPICFHECGNIPTVSELKDSGAYWTYFMTWHTDYIKNNDTNKLKEIYNDDYVITLDELPNFGGGSYQPPVDSSSQTESSSQPEESSSVADQPSSDVKSQAAKNVLNYIASEQGSHIITGQQESTWKGGNDPDYEMKYVYQNTGKYPAIRGLDFMGNDFAGVTNRAKEWWQAGGIPTIAWHTGADYASGYDNCMSDGFNNNMVVEGTSEYNAMIAGIDNAAKYLKELKDAGVVVLWRPYHELDGGWFWWSKGGADNFKKLWQIMYDRYTNYWGLDNLIWVCGFSGNNNGYGDWYPGNEYVDIVGADSYDENDTVRKDLYDAMWNLVQGQKPICFHECGRMPSIGEYANQSAYWAYFMTWHDHVVDHNDTGNLKDLYNSDYAITRDELPKF